MNVTGTMAAKARAMIERPLRSLRKFVFMLFCFLVRVQSYE